jgi:hypothetical protein
MFFIWVIFGSFSAEFKIILQFRQSKLLSIPHHAEPAKLYLLVGCLLTCLCTLSRHQASVWALDLPVHPTKVPSKIKTGSEKVFGFHAARRGSNKQEGGCSKEFHTSSRCDHTVAPKHINMGGCSYKNQELALCVVEWCVGIGGDRAAQAIVNRNVNKPEQS